jgi:hypothetical protein
MRFVLNGWQWSGKVYWHTGMPYSIMDGNDNGGIGNGGGTILGTINPGAPYKRVVVESPPSTHQHTLLECRGVLRYP